MSESGSESDTAASTHETVGAAAPALVEVRGLRKQFSIHQSLLRPSKGAVKAVDGVDLDIVAGETFGLVGESGCGKSTLGRLLVRLLEPTAGAVRFQGVDIARFRGSRLRQQRADMQMIFQDPFGSLDPRWRIERAIAEPLRAHGLRGRSQLRTRVETLLNAVGLDESMADRLPHQMSGGQRQRVGIARAVALQPKLIVADEPVSALDVSVQAQIVNLLMDLQERLGLTYVFVAHGLDVVRHVSTRIGVMYLGRIVEQAPTETLFANFAHPYTASLLSAIPAMEQGRRHQRIVLSGEVGSAASLPSGCRFHPRCPRRQQRCEVDDPTLRELSPHHFVACHFPLTSRTDRVNFLATATPRARPTPKPQEEQP